MTQQERAKIVFEETYKVMGDEMATFALLALAFSNLSGNQGVIEKIERVRAACAERGVKVED